MHARWLGGASSPAPHPPKGTDRRPLPPAAGAPAAPPRGALGHRVRQPVLHAGWAQRLRASGACKAALESLPAASTKGLLPSRVALPWPSCPPHPPPPTAVGEARVTHVGDQQPADIQVSARATCNQRGMPVRATACRRELRHAEGGAKGLGQLCCLSLSWHDRVDLG